MIEHNKVGQSFGERSRGSGRRKLLAAALLLFFRLHMILIHTPRISIKEWGVRNQKTFLGLSQLGLLIQTAFSQREFLYWIDFIKKLESLLFVYIVLILAWKTHLMTISVFFSIFFFSTS